MDHVVDARVGYVHTGWVGGMLANDFFQNRLRPWKMLIYSVITLIEKVTIP